MMGSRSSLRSQQVFENLHGLCEDRLSSLPDNMIETILLRLPLRDAVITSILSSSWRYQWSTLPELVFKDINFPRNANQTQAQYDKGVVSMIDQVLLLHRGPIHKFKFCLDFTSSVHIDRWLLFVSRNCVKEIVVYKLGDIYKVPNCLFSCKNIIRLKLKNCTWFPPPTFIGYKNLTKLDLRFINCSRNGLENLISRCPLLNKLVLIWVYGCDHLSIFAPKLVYFEVEDLQHLRFENTPILAELSICLLHAEESVNMGNEVACKLVHLLCCLPSVRRLKLVGSTFQFLSAGGNVPARLPATCQLSHLSFTIDFEDKKQMLVALCIFRSSKALQKVEIVSKSNKGISVEDVNDFWKAQKDLNCLFSRLQIINVTEYSGIASELKFIEFVLANTPVLEVVKIEIKGDMSDVTNKLKIHGKLTQMNKVSSKAQIVIPELEIPLPSN